MQVKELTGQYHPLLSLSLSRIANLSFFYSRFWCTDMVLTLISIISIHHIILFYSPSFSLTTFSPSGKLVQVSDRKLLILSLEIIVSLSITHSSCILSSLIHFQQIEHALAAVSSGTTSLGIKGKSSSTISSHLSLDLPRSHSSRTSTDQKWFLSSNFLLIPSHPSHTTASNSIVIAVEKRPPSPLVDDSSLERISLICPNIGIVYSGMGPDFRVLVAKARKSAQAYWKIYGEYPTTRVLVQELAQVMQEATQSGWVNLIAVDSEIGWRKWVGELEVSRGQFRRGRRTWGRRVSIFEVIASCHWALSGSNLFQRETMRRFRASESFWSLERSHFVRSISTFSLPKFHDSDLFLFLFLSFPLFTLLLFPPESFSII